MNCAAITADDLLVIGQWFGATSVCFVVLGLSLFKLIECSLDALANGVRKRGAAAPFAARAAAFEKLAARWSRLSARIVERNRREAERSQS
jgi:hypothetical protein